MSQIADLDQEGIASRRQLLAGGRGAAAGPRSTLWVVGAFDSPPPIHDVAIPAERRVLLPVGFTVERHHDLVEQVHPTGRPPRLRVEAATLSRCNRLDREDAVADLVIRVVQRRLTTAGRLRDCVAAQARHRWRALLTDVLTDVDSGVRSPLELRWLRNVERPHGLPPSSLNQPETMATGREYRDAEFPRFGLVIEMDGKESHPTWEAFRDRRRDNRVTVSGRATLRYGWHEIAGDPCAVASEVTAVLHTLGWTGTPHPCSPTCRLGA